MSRKQNNVTQEILRLEWKGDKVVIHVPDNINVRFVPAQPEPAQPPTLRTTSTHRPRRCRHRAATRAPRSPKGQKARLGGRRLTRSAGKATGKRRGKA